MLTFRKGTGAGPDAARAMAEYLAELPTESISIADYYLRGMVRAEAEGAAAVPRQDMPVELAQLLGIDLTRTATKEEVANLLHGVRADGKPIPGKREMPRVPGRDRITYIDFTFSAPKPVSVAMALAPTPAERHIIIGAHRDAVASTMLHLETIIGNTRRGAGGSKGYVPGQLGWVSFDHYTARPAVELPHREADGTPSTLIHTVDNPAVSADMQLHTHVITPNVVLAEDGRVGSMDTLALHDRVLEVGALYQAYLATHLRSVGVDVQLDAEKGAATLPKVPERVNRIFSKRHHEGEDAARDYIRSLGLDWDQLSPQQIIGALRFGNSRTRRAKENEPIRGSDFDRWKEEAARAGYVHASVIEHNPRTELPPPRESRLLHAYQTSLPLLDRKFQTKAVMMSTVARTMAAQALIATGVEEAADIAEITELMRQHGVQHDGRIVPIVWADVPPAERGSVDDRRRRVKITTTRHIEMERETIDLLAAAADDRSGALTPAEIERGIRVVSARDGLDFDNEHGREQRRIIEALGTSGRVGAAIGVAGAGKSTLLRPLVEAWQNPESGQPRQVIGTAVAWRQSSPLADAGIPAHRAMATAKLRFMVEQGHIKLDRNTVVVVDELSQVGTKFALQLARWQRDHGFTLVAIGDDKQAQAVSAGSSIGLLRRALGEESVPEITSSVRQLRGRDRETALLFRAGNAGAAIERLREDGHALLVPGGRRHAIEAVADLWEQRMAANRDRADFSLTVSAPTNYDARAISAVIRERRRRMGQVGADSMQASAVDQNGAEYELPLAVGDRVRLFARTIGSIRGRSGSIGENGSVLQVEAIRPEGLQLRNSKGTSAFVRWETLADKPSGRIRLSYGDVISIDAIQSATSTEHINALPSGSFATEGFRAYVAQSRAREISWLVVPDGLERVEISTKRAQGNTDPITESDVWANVAANLSRQPEKELATGLLEEATRVFQGEVRSLATAFQRTQQREHEGRRPGNGFQERRDESEVREAAPDIARTAKAAGAAAQGAVKQIAGPDTRNAIRDARRSVRPAASRPKRKETTMPHISETEAQSQFADALRQAGLIIKGAPMMDGRMHRVAVEGDKRGRKSGAYKAYLDGVPAGYIHNHKTGQEIRWKASSPTRPMTSEERATWQLQVEADREARETLRRKTEAAAAQRAQAVWRQAKPAANHPYLNRKRVWGHGLRRDNRNNLLVPMQDMEGKLWGLQTISEDGRKLYGKGARKNGMHAVLGELHDEDPVILAEGFATAATMREATGLPVVVAFDSGNLAHVAEAYRAAAPERAIIFAADNDHHLPRRDPPLANVGVESAQQAAAAIGGKTVVLVPPFLPEEKGTDWNDAALRDGLGSIRKQLGEALAPAGIQLREWKPPQMNQAARDAARERMAGFRPKSARPSHQASLPQPRGPEPEAPAPEA